MMITTKWEAWPWEELERSFEEIQPDIVINTTSVGMLPRVDETPLRADLLSPEMIVVDLIYNPLPTRLLREASQTGARIVHGLNMLIMQAVEAMEVWSGKRLDIETRLPELQNILVEKTQR